MVAPKICEVGGSGTFFPLFPDEHSLEPWVRAAIYGPLLLYCFFGASMVADYFMDAIEKITSQKTVKINPITFKISTEFIWNPTVANLSLMALGSSAPEIMLSVVEVVSAGFHSGELGPATIVGSAAFNYFVIIAVCVAALPSGETRQIERLDVYYVTQVFGIVAYVWLLLVVEVMTPNIITVLEGAVTIGLFVLLLGTAYIADRGLLGISRVGKGPRQVCVSNEFRGGVMKPRARNHMQKRINRMGKAARYTADVAQWRAEQSTCWQESSTPLEQEDEKPMGDVYYYTKPDGHDTQEREVSTAGTLTFMSEFVETKGSTEKQPLDIIVLREGGSDGHISCHYYLEQHTALPGYDYRDTSGHLYFQPGEAEKKIHLEIFPRRANQRSVFFQLVLDELKGGATFYPDRDGGERCCILTIRMGSPATATGSTVYFDRDAIDFGLAFWSEQIKDAFKMEAQDEGEKIKSLDYIFHFVALPWKIYFALTSPPTFFLGGWLLFFCALIQIGWVTVIVCDLASLFGCVLDIEDAVTAIVIVSPGTSLPDLFASKSAALADPIADASIVNVAGSNSVNVFLGIGVSWMVCAVYWTCTGSTPDWRERYPDVAKQFPSGGFVVKAGTLSYSVAVYTTLYLCGTCLLFIRRKICGGELGGTTGWQASSAIILVALWILYVASSIWKTKSDDAVIALIVFLVLALICTCTTIYVEKTGGKGKQTDAASNDADTVRGDVDVPSKPFGKTAIANVDDQKVNGKFMDTEVYSDVDDAEIVVWNGAPEGDNPQGDARTSVEQKREAVASLEDKDEIDQGSEKKKKSSKKVPKENTKEQKDSKDLKDAKEKKLPKKKTPPSSTEGGQEKPHRSTIESKGKLETE
mmetsp:Transcript_97069/g.274349  ORF Transcript_97069/g.274349 Transcript_97069/m.274349 type:complete len:868 (+) Transcript_97069:103-2706(+)